MRKFLPLLLLISIGTVFAIGLVDTNIISTGIDVNTGIETKSLSANNIIQSTTLPANFTIFASALEEFGHEGASECINNNGKFELKCSDDSIIYTYASCLGAGYYDFGEETINMNTQSWSQSPNGYTVCVSEDFSILPDSL